MKIPITLICASIIGHLLNAGHAPRHWGCRDELCQGPCPSGTGEGGENKIINKLMSEIALGRYEQWLHPRTLVMEEKGSQRVSVCLPWHQLVSDRSWIQDHIICVLSSTYIACFWIQTLNTSRSGHSSPNFVLHCFWKEDVWMKGRGRQGSVVLDV